jgi:two-component system, NarL family, nitrate/nitrite response regulator NarL
MPDLEPESESPDHSTIRLVIVDDHPLFREATVAALRTDPQITVLGQGSSATEALEMAVRLQPDLVLLDVAMPGGGLNAARNIAEAQPKIKLVMLTFSEEEDDVRKALGAGIRGYVLKGIGGSDLRRIVRAVANGETYLAPTLAH